MCALLAFAALATAQDADRIAAAKSSVFGVSARRVVEMRGRQFPMQVRQIAVAISADGVLLTPSLGTDPQNVRVFLQGTTDGIEAEVVDSDDSFTLLRIEQSDMKPIAWAAWSPSAGQKVVWVGMLAGGLGRWTAVTKEARVDAVVDDPASDHPIVYSDPPFSGPVASMGGLVLNGAGEAVGIIGQMMAQQQPGGGGRRGFMRRAGMPVVKTSAEFAQYLGGATGKRGVLGVSVETLTETVADALGMKGTRGAIVTQITPGSGAEKAGIVAQDVIVRVGDMAVTNAASLQQSLARSKADDTVEVELLRVEDGKAVTKKITATLGARDSAGRKDRVRNKRFGFVAAPLTASIRRQYQLTADVQGVYVRRVTQGSPASLGRPTGLRRGDIIERVGDMPVENLEKLKEALKAAVNGTPVRLFVRHATETRFVEITPENPGDDG